MWRHFKSNNCIEYECSIDYYLACRMIWNTDIENYYFRHYICDDGYTSNNKIEKKKECTENITKDNTIPWVDIKRISTLESLKNHKICLFIIYFHIFCINNTSNVVRTYIIWCSYTYGIGTYGKPTNWCKRWRESLQNHQNEWMESAGTFCRHANIVTDRFQCTQRGLSTDEGWFLERNRSGILIMI